MLNLFDLIMRLAWGTNGQQKVDIIQFISTQIDVFNLFNLWRLAWGTNGQQKVLLSAPEVESIRSELSYMEEKEAHLKAGLEHIDETLRSSHLSGYLQIRTRWTALPGELLPLDDIEVDDWLPRFVVIQGPCILFYCKSTDVSPQDSTLLSDVVEIGCMPRHPEEEGETRYYFYIVTRQGLRYECSTTSKSQVDAWLTTLQEECKLGFDSTTIDHSPAPKVSYHPQKNQSADHHHYRHRPFSISYQPSNISAAGNNHLHHFHKFDRPLAEHHHPAFEECNQTPPNDEKIFEKMLGARHGHVNGIKHKRSSNVSRYFEEGRSSQPPKHTPSPKSKQKDEIAMMLDDPVFRVRLIDMMHSYTPQDDGENDEDRDDDID